MSLAHMAAFCAEFDELLKSGEGISLDEFLQRVDGPLRPRIVPWLADIEAQYVATQSFRPEEISTARPKRSETIQNSADPAGDSLESTIDYQAETKLGAPNPFASDKELPIGQFGNYELLSEIARGGMGIVYRARQRGLNRIVALKMIRSAQLAGAEEIGRFYAEAEAAAQLDHPNIVPVFEVGGVQDGQHFFSMGYIDGESLHQRIARGPLPPRLAAQLMKTVADAVAYAHERGIVHRDLKPANVLIDRDGQPRITDFGLAKRVEGDSGLTATGQVMGTPSYMPPEQAAGKTSEVGPLADVYSLGSTLYCLLTGRPPFQAATATETLIQVLEEDPVLPRVLNPVIDKDLETICLRCMQKQPQLRYASARGVRDELERFLDGEPILASRSNWKSKLARTLSRSRDDVKFSSWSQILLYFAAIVWFAELGIFLAKQGVQAELALGVRIVQFVTMGSVFWSFRNVWRGSSMASVEHMWTLWLGFIIGCHLIAVSVVQLSHVVMPGARVEILACYPYFATLSGFLFLALGRNFWGYCYAIGSLFFALSLVLPYCLPFAPLIFGTAWAATLVVIAARLRRIAASNTDSVLQQTSI